MSKYKCQPDMGFLLFSPLLKSFCTNIKPIRIAKTTNQDWLKTKESIYEVTSFLDQNNPLGIRYYCILNDIFTIPLCQQCKVNQCVVNKLDSNLGFTRFCSPKCSRSLKRLPKETLSKLQNYDWLYEQRIVLEKSKEQIAKELGCSTIPVVEWIQKHDIPVVRYNESNTKTLLFLRDKAWLSNQYLTLKKTCDVIAVELQSSKSTVSIWLQKHSITTRNSNEYPRKTPKITKPTKEIIDFIQTFYKGEVKTNIRGIIGSLELDIFIPEKMLAIEYNGVYSHLYRPEETSFSGIKGPKYHVTKTNLCESLGINLIHIFSYQWETKKNIWKSIIRNKFGSTERKIWARNCDIKEVPVYTKNKFLDENHIQGRDKSKIKLGLYYNEEIVSIMTLGKPRYSKRADYELIRFATATNTNVVGGFSKLISWFQKSNPGKSIVSYADRTYSSGGVYEANGFILDRVNPPSYKYVLKNTETMIHRSNLTKKKLSLVTTDKTEEEMAEELGYSKIFDCGTKTYILKPKQT